MGAGQFTEATGAVGIKQSLQDHLKWDIKNIVRGNYCFKQGWPECLTWLCNECEGNVFGGWGCAFLCLKSGPSCTSLLSSRSLKQELEVLMDSLHHFPEWGRSRSVSFHCVWSREALWLLRCVWVETVSSESERRQHQGFPPWSRINSTHIRCCRGRSSGCRSPPEMGVGGTPNGCILEKNLHSSSWRVSHLSGVRRHFWIYVRRKVMGGIQIIYTMHNLHISHEWKSCFSNIPWINVFKAAVSRFCDGLNTFSLHKFTHSRASRATLMRPFVECICRSP